MLKFLRAFTDLLIAIAGLMTAYVTCEKVISSKKRKTAPRRPHSQNQHKKRI